MGKLADLVAYVREYRANASQLTHHVIAGDWFRSGTPVADAIRWADLGYLPGEAEPLIQAGVTPEMASAGNAIEMQVMAEQPSPISDAIEHGDMELAAKLMSELVKGTPFVDPGRVRSEVDQDNPNHIIVTILPGDPGDAIDTVTEQFNNILDQLGPPPGDDELDQK